LVGIIYRFSNFSVSTKHYHLSLGLWIH